MLRSGLLVSFVLLWAGCGSSTDNVVAPTTQAQSDQNSFSLKALNFTEQSFERDPNNANVLYSINRSPKLILTNYEVWNEAVLSSNQSLVSSGIISGIGLEAVDSSNRALRISIGVIAREFDQATGKFGSRTQFFAAPSFDRASVQKIGLDETRTDPQVVMTGLALRMIDGTFTKLVLQRRPFGDLYGFTSSIEAANQVVLPAGWAAISLEIRIERNDLNAPRPFIDDARIYLGYVSN